MHENATSDDFPTVEQFEDLFVNNADFDKVKTYLQRFNPIRVMRMENMEIRHSAILAWLLDPLETHGLDDTFLRAFLTEALRGQDARHKPSALEVSQADLRDSEVRREKQNIDIFVASPTNGWAFIVENKFHSKQHSGQLKRYLDHAISEANDQGLEFRCRGIFLTLHDEDPEEDSRDDYTKLRYADICTILDRILNELNTNVGSEVRQFLNHYLEIIKDSAGTGDAISKALADPDCNKGTAIQSLKSDLYALKDKLELTVLDERKAVIAAVDDCAAKVAQTPEFQALAQDERERINRSIDTHKAGLEVVKMIPILRDRANGAKLDLLPRILAEVDRLSRPAPSARPNQGMGERPAEPFGLTYVNASELKVAFAKHYLTDEADVEQYVQEMKKTLLEQIRAGKKVIV